VDYQKCASWALLLSVVSCLVSCNTAPNIEESNIGTQNKWGTPFVDKPKIVWSNKLKECPHSIEVVDNNLVVSIGEDNIESYSINNGQTIWKIEEKDPLDITRCAVASKIGRDNTLPTDKLFIIEHVEGTHEYAIQRRSIESGDVIIEKKLVLQFPYPVQPFEDNFIYDKDSNSVYVIYSEDENIFLKCFDADTLYEKWIYEYPQKEFHINTPCINLVNDISKDHVIVSYGDGYSCLSASTGEELWAFSNEYCYTKLCRYAEVFGNRLIISFHNGYGIGRPYVHDLATGELLYEDTMSKFRESDSFSDFLMIDEDSIAYVPTLSQQKGFDIKLLSKGQIQHTGYRIATDAFEIINSSITPLIDLCYADDNVFIAFTPLSISCHSLEQPETEPGYPIYKRLLWTYYTKDLEEIYNNQSSVTFDTTNHVIVCPNAGKIIYWDESENVIACIRHTQ